MSERHVDVGALLRGRLRGRQGQQARAHLQRCSQCREAHDALLLAERALGDGDLDAPGVFEREAVLEAVLAEVAPPRQTPLRLWWGVPALAAAGALVLVLLRPVDGGFVERAAPGSGEFAMRGFCVTGTQAQQLTAAGSCTRGATLVATATRPARQDWQPSLWLVDAAGVAHAGEHADASALQPAQGEQVIDAYIDLDASVALGPARLLVVWTADGSEGTARALVENADQGTPDDAAVAGMALVIAEVEP